MTKKITLDIDDDIWHELKSNTVRSITLNDKICLVIKEYNEKHRQ